MIVRLRLLLALTSCAVDLDTSTVEQGVFYCYADASRPILCFPWDDGGDWDWCNGQCWAFEGTGGYCPEATPLEWEFCGRRENRGSIRCTVDGQPRFPHYCVSGEFPLTDVDGAP